MLHIKQGLQLCADCFIDLRQLVFAEEPAAKENCNDNGRCQPKTQHVPGAVRLGCVRRRVNFRFGVPLKIVSHADQGSGFSRANQVSINRWVDM